MGKLSFILGAGAGYVLGTRAGRARYEQIKGATAKLWENPRVQQNVQKVETRVADAAKQSGSAVTDKVASAVKGKLSGARGGNGQSPQAGYPMGETGNVPSGQMPPTPPQPPL